MLWLSTSYSITRVHECCNPGPRWGKLGLDISSGIFSCAPPAMQAPLFRQPAHVRLPVLFALLHIHTPSHPGSAVPVRRQHRTHSQAHYHKPASPYAYTQCVQTCHGIPLGSIHPKCTQIMHAAQILAGTGMLTHKSRQFRLLYVSIQTVPTCNQSSSLPARYPLQRKQPSHACMQVHNTHAFD